MARRSSIYAVLLVIAISMPAQALRFYVDPATGDNRRSHVLAQDPDTPWRTITYALQIAHVLNQGRPHVIDIAAGTYSPSSGETFPLVVSKTDIYLRSQGNVILDGQRQSRILEITAPTSDFVLRNFSLVNGFADRGGAVSCTTCTLRVVDSRLIGNVSEQGGDIISVTDGKLRLNSNNLRFNGTVGGNSTLIEVRNTFADTTQSDIIRNNTFYQNNSSAILTTGNRTDISSNIFVGIPGDGVPTIIDSADGIEPLVRYNLFWDTDILYLSEDRDTVQVTRTVRDTTTLEEQGVDVPSFVTNVPDTVASVDTEYVFDIALDGDESDFKFNVINSGDIPIGMDEAEIEQDGILRWTPTASQTGQHAVRVEIIREAPTASVEFLSYLITVFTAEDFPDTTTPGDIITVEILADTSGAIDSLNQILPSFSVAASAAGNVYGDPLFLNVDVNRFELVADRVRTIVPAGDTVAVLDTVESVAIDGGNPIASLHDAVVGAGGLRNDIGSFGGPRNGGPPDPGSAGDGLATALPDTLATEGVAWVYEPELSPSANIIIIDLIQGPPTMGTAFGSGKSLPPTWVPAVQDTGQYLVGVQTFYSGGSARHYFPLRVRAANARPRIVSTAPSTVAEDDAFVYEIDAVDEDGDPLTYRLDAGPDGMTVDSLGVVRWNPLQADVGVVEVTVAISDSGGAHNTHSFSLEVTDTNDAPVLTGWADTTATEDAALVVQLGVTDEDPSDSVFVFTLASGPDSAAIDEQNRFLWTPRQADVGSTTATVVVADPGGATDSVTVTVTVIQVDDPPVVTSTPDTTAQEDSLYQYTITGVDEEGETLQFTLVSAPTEMTVDSLGVVRWTPTVSDTGSHDITVRIGDPGGQTDEQSYTLTVTEINDSPVIVSRTPADTLVLLDPRQAVRLSLEVEDEEADPLTYQWVANGVDLSTEESILFVPDTTSADTVVVNVNDGTSSTSATWIVDARAIAKISVATDTVDFGDVVLGDTASVALPVRNPGRTTLTIADLQLGDLSFTADFGTGSIALRDSTTLTLRFIPPGRGERTTAVQFTTNDPDIPSLSIPLRGAGVVPTTASLDANLAAGDQALTQTQAQVGSSVSLDIEVDRALDLVAASVELTFDADVLTFDSFSANAGDVINLLGDTTTVAVSEPSSGSVRIELSGAAAGDVGPLGRVTFVVADDATTGSQSLVNVDLLAVTSSGVGQADSLSVAGVSLDIAAAQPGDISGDGGIDFDDFFLFADDFGTSATRSDFNSDGTVDFTDFFLFADFFNAAAARPIAVAGTGLEGLSLSTAARAGSADRLDVAVRWPDSSTLRGAALWVRWDPQHLSLEEATSIEPDDVLVWSRVVGGDHAEIASAPVGGATFERDVVTLRFHRRSGLETEIRIVAATGRTVDGGRLQPLTVPDALRVEALPRVATMYPAHPNPFNPETVIPFYVPGSEGERIRIRVYDLLGRVVRTLAAETFTAGHHRVVWHGRDNAGRPAGAGVYLVELVAESQRQVRKVMLLK